MIYINKSQILCVCVTAIETELGRRINKQRRRVSKSLSFKFGSRQIEGSLTEDMKILCDGQSQLSRILSCCNTARHSSVPGFDPLKP